jgi:hypothetical protein
MKRFDIYNPKFRKNTLFVILEIVNIGSSGLVGIIKHERVNHGDKYFIDDEIKIYNEFDNNNTFNKVVLLDFHLKQMGFYNKPQILKIKCNFDDKGYFINLLDFKILKIKNHKKCKN